VGSNCLTLPPPGGGRDATVLHCEMLYCTGKPVLGPEIGRGQYGVVRCTGKPVLGPEIGRGQYGVVRCTGKPVLGPEIGRGQYGVV